ncbi:chromate transporter [Pseudoroseomonas wenyumeiae]
MASRKARGSRRHARCPAPPTLGGTAPPPSSRELFLGFLALGLMGFGGVLPLARSMLVERRRWMSAEAFTELLGLCQFLPGGNIINLAVAVGLEFRGVAGAFAALMGLIAGPTAVVVALGVVYARFQDDPTCSISSPASPPPPPGCWWPPR